MDEKLVCSLKRDYLFKLHCSTCSVNWSKQTTQIKDTCRVNNCVQYDRLE